MFQFKVMAEYEESLKEKPAKKIAKKRRCKCKKGYKKIKEKSDEEFESLGLDEDALNEKSRQFQLKKCKETTTLELISFLKDLVERDQRRREKTTEEKSVSPYVSEELVTSFIYEEEIEEEFIEEDEEEEGEEEEEEEAEEEGEEEAAHEDDVEGAVDMNEVIILKLKAVLSF